MKPIFAALILILTASVATAQDDCKRCGEIAALEKKVLEELPKEEPDTAAYDVEAAKIINSLGKLSPAQADQIVRYLKSTLPTDPSRAIIESLWPTISKNMDVIKKAASKLPAVEADRVQTAITHYDNSLKYGQDPAPSTPKKSK